MVATTGSLLKTTEDGLANGLDSPTGKIVTIIDGTPDAKLQVSITSGVAFDVANGQYYMGKAGSSWIKLGSVK